MADDRCKVAVLGGGVGALSAAWFLTNDDRLRARFDVTVYQQGWRLGGKCHAGRDASMHQRIEEHGFHIWLGTYHNALGLARDLYDEYTARGLAAGVPIDTFDRAFAQHSRLTAMEEVSSPWVPWASPSWTPWTVDVPTNTRKPGEGSRFFSPVGYLRALIDWLVAQVANPVGLGGAPAAGVSAIAASWVEPVLTRAITAFITFRGDVEDVLGAIDDLGDQIEQQMPQPLIDLASAIDDVVLEAAAIWSVLTGSHELRRLLELCDLVTATAIGMIRDQVLTRGFDAIDGEEYRAWLRRHGATKRSADSAAVRSLYDLVFAYEGGRDDQPNIAAGTATRVMLRLFFDYNGAFSFKMQSAMADVVIAPLYRVLVDRGVKFEFFHRVDQLRLSSDGSAIKEIDVGVQATTVSSGKYEPLIDVAGTPTWPNAPDYAQLNEGPTMQTAGVDLESAWSPWKASETAKTLVCGTDFHEVVLGISVGALKHICPELAAHDPAWQAMVDDVATVQTQAFQVWLDADDAQIGGIGIGRPVFGAYETSGGEMSDVLPREQWPAGAVKSLYYLCRQLDDASPIAPFSDPTFPALEAARVKGNSIDTLTNDAGRLWPGISDPGAPDSIDFSRLVDTSGGVGVARFDAQYWRANINPSDRYVLSLAGTTSKRMKSDASGFDNLSLAGDWTLNGINAGSVEAAVMSGMQAARGLGGSPHVVIGEGDFPPAGDPTVTGTPPGIASPSLKPYIYRAGEQVYSHPILLSNVKAFAFPVEADGGALVSLVDRHLNAAAPPNVRYFPLSNAMFVAAAFIDRLTLTPASADADKAAFLREIDVAFWLPVFRFNKVGPLWMLDGFHFYHPVLYVDHPMAVAAGREIYGFHKAMARFDPAGASTLPEKLTVYSWPATELNGAPLDELKDRRVLELRNPNVGAGGPSFGASPLTGPPAVNRVSDEIINVVLPGGRRGLKGSAVQAADPVFDVPPPVSQQVTFKKAAAVIAAVGIDFSSVFLKQFRHVADGALACYQSITEAKAASQLTGFNLNFFLDEWELEVFEHDSHPFVAELGLSTNPQGVTGFAADISFEMGNGVEVE